MRENLTPEDALRHIGDIDRRARRPARTTGLILLVMGFANIPYWLAMSLGPDWSKYMAMVSWFIMTIFIVVLGHRWSQQAQDREVTRVNRPTGPVTITTLVMTAVMVAGTFLLPEHPGAGWVTLVVALTVCTSLPMFYAAWRILRAER
ncbi:hypothetical protein [Planomonospora venezuelensis]|uniref:ABC-type xylose transport system permease subunit n=1 Tax=Planomonospora venezuelensis TaxID=1999 RepID=A0A841D461_PLAVE|nr:hypothetical protein [Planomonospora venezuelensis]MBB5965442.1 ABC-type xylose transport system permease subunit [Planomonospora venezuelensis]GIN03427.1 hypothetical protein Pve01_50850 [Planomonospora venezuelensis]